MSDIGKLNETIDEVNRELTTVHKRIAALEDKRAADIVELEDQIAQYRAEGSHHLKRYNAVVDILLRLLNNGGLNPADV